MQFFLEYPNALFTSDGSKVLMTVNNTSPPISSYTQENFASWGFKFRNNGYQLGVDYVFRARPVYVGDISDMDFYYNLADPFPITVLGLPGQPAGVAFCAFDAVCGLDNSPATPGALCITLTAPIDVGYGSSYSWDQTTERLNLLYGAELSLFSSFNVTYCTATDLLFYDSTTSKTDYFFQVSDLPTLTKFYLRIQAQNDAGGGEWSSGTADTVLDVPTAPVPMSIESKETTENAYYFILLHFDPVESSGDGTRDLVPINFYEGELSDSSYFSSSIAKCPEPFGGCRSNSSR
eukprot:3323175-Rhodomonas_salina.3